MKDCKIFVDNSMRSFLSHQDRSRRLGLATIQIFDDKGNFVSPNAKYEFSVWDLARQDLIAQIRQYCESHGIDLEIIEKLNR